MVTGWALLFLAIIAAFAVVAAVFEFLEGRDDGTLQR